MVATSDEPFPPPTQPQPPPPSQVVQKMRMDEIEPKRLPETSAYVAEEEKVEAAKEKADSEKAAAKVSEWLGPVLGPV